MDDSIHPIFRNRPAPDTKLWRYLSFAKFAAFLQSRQLHFTRVDQFDDHFEGAWPKSDLEWWSQPSNKLNLTKFTDIMRDRVAASCWIKGTHESAAMWRLYTQGSEGVAVTTTFAKLEAALLPFTDSEASSLAGAACVAYTDHATEGLIEKLGPDEHLPGAFAPYMIKNKSYEYEQEVRALVVAGRGYEMDVAGCDVPIDLTVFVDDIIVSPFGQAWFVEAVSGIADQYGLKDKLKRSALSPDLFYGKRGPLRP